MQQKQINKISKTILSCNNDEQLKTTMEWINRLKDEHYFSRKDKWLINEARLKYYEKQITNN